MRDTTSLIWDHLYFCSVPQLESTSVQYLRQHGTYVTGDKGIDQEMSRQWLNTMININTMVEYFREGVAIRVLHYADTKIIYESISEHLAAWRNLLTRGINIGDAPIDDLILMDEFANVVYEHARYQFTQETVASILGQHMGNLTRFNNSNFFNAATTRKMQDNNDGIIRAKEFESDTPDRESHSQFLKNRIVGIRNWRS